MRRRITVIGGSQTAAVCALLLAQRDYADLVLLDASSALAEDVLLAGAVGGFGPAVSAGDRADLAGSDVVVVAELAAGMPAELATRCPDAVAVVATGDCETACDALLQGTRWPRGRVIGISGLLDDAAARLADATARAINVRDAQPGGAAAGAGATAAPAGPLATAAAVREVVDAVVFDRRRALSCLVSHGGEHGVDGWAVAQVTLGAAGVEAIL